MQKASQQITYTARLLEIESGGILVALEKLRRGHAIILYRGKNYSRRLKASPDNLFTKREALQRSIEIQRRGVTTLFTSRQREKIMDFFFPSGLRLTSFFLGCSQWNILPGRSNKQSGRWNRDWWFSILNYCFETTKLVRNSKFILYIPSIAEISRSKGKGVGYMISLGPSQKFALRLNSPCWKTDAHVVDLASASNGHFSRRYSLSLATWKLIRLCCLVTFVKT